MKRIATLAVLLGMAAAPAGAQTVLTIGANGQVNAAPDEATASLTAQMTSPDAAKAQAQVNAMMSKALEEARGVSGVVATTGSYDTSQQSTDTQPPQTVYQASQTLSLVLPAADGIPPARFTDLVGKLQGQGLLLNDLGGDLSAKAQQDAQQAAVLAAISQIQAQAAAVAAQLHESVGAVKTLNVNAQAAPGPRPFMGMAMKAMAVPPPVSAPGNITVTADVTAEVELDAAH
ncbi:SIMPL domain-containing protein [Acidocella aromatica]|uniref:Uncharacterized protein YggE n=1 Tax=Acidocella aromatica TaxID=1303579 RepID=A0A840VSQ3_9PROT|nr:SIMPL domain-containing protein [Acidocella aromatica]MBB5373252.1 uncharacterized protein YggE [Acidocella aromatica]